MGTETTIGHVLGSSYDDKSGVVLIQVGDNHSKVVEANDVEVWPSLGIIGRPAPADPGVASCDVLCIRGVDHWLGVGFRDVRRQQEVLGNSNPGDTIVYALKGMASVKCGADGSVTLYTSSDNTNGGAAVMLRISPSGLLFSSPFGTLTFDATGFHVYDRSGASVDAGSIGMPDPFSAVSSVVSITAAAIQLDGAVLLGKGPNFMNVVGNATPGPVAATPGALPESLASGTVMTSVP